MILQAQIRDKIEQEKIESKLFDLRKRALSQPEFKRPAVPEVFPPRKRFKSIEVPKPKSLNIRKAPQEPKNEVINDMKLETSEDENKEDSYFELIEEPTSCKKISMEERGDAFVLFFKPGQNPVVMKFDNHVLPDEVCVTK